MTQATISFSTGSLYLYGLERVFMMAAEVGFEGIELIVDERLDTRQPEHLQRLMDTYKLPITSVHSPFLGAQLIGWEADSVQRIKASVKLAESVGAAHVVMHVPDRIRKVKYQVGGRKISLPWIAIQSLAIYDWMRSGGLGRFQATTDVCICVENLPTKFDDLRLRWPQINQQRLSYWNTLDSWPQAHEYLTLDTTHWATHNIDPVAAYNAGADRVRHIHLSNFKAGKEHQLPHGGGLDLAVFLQELIANSFDGHIVVELNPSSLKAHDPALACQNMRDSLAFVREHFA